jgi:hypothetical protein
MFKVNQMYVKKTKTIQDVMFIHYQNNWLKKVYTCYLIFRGLSVFSPFRNVPSKGDL